MKLCNAGLCHTNNNKLLITIIGVHRSKHGSMTYNAQLLHYSVVCTYRTSHYV